MINHIRGLLVVVGLGISLITGVTGYSQSLEKHNWYFGNTQRAIRFNRVTNTASLLTNKAVPFGNGGSAVATDRGNANLLFYTDGNRVYGANHVIMPNGGGLNANNASNQPAAITSIPGQPGKYFIFTNTAAFPAAGTISYSIVDMTQFGAAAFPAPPLGDVTTKNTAIPTLNNLSEGMITIPHANKRDFWLITQTLNSRQINATLIDAASFTANTFNTVQSTVITFPTSAAHLAYHETLKKLAIAPQDPSTNAVILTFNDATGVFSLPEEINSSGVLATTNQSIYDVEWSPSGQYLYLSRHGEAGINADVLQYDYTNSSITLTSVLTAPVFRSYGLQRGPDNFIYHLFQSVSGGPFLLGRIEQPDSVAAKTKYVRGPGAFNNLNFDGKQFPGFTPKDTISLKLDFTFAGTCQNSPTMFFPSVRPGADSLQWALGDGSTARGWGPIHTYQSAGAQNVVLRAFYQGKVDSVSKPVPISAFALTLTLPNDTTACKEEFPPPRGSSSPKQFQVTVKVQGGTPASIVWSNGNVGPILKPDSAGYYYVVVTDASGCSAYAGVNVKEYGKTTQIFNKWYFGNKAGIDFSKTPAQALSESAMNAPEGCAIACDKNGQQIFYTDGNTVWDKTHAVIETNIGGNPLATQSSIVVPVPDDETLFYIFTTQDIDNGTDSLQLMYSVFDLKKNSGKGQIVKKSVLLFMKSTERVTANNRWLVVHDLGNSTFRTYPITADGIGNQVYSDIGSDHSAAIPENAKGYMKLGPRNIVAVPLSSPGVSNHIEIFQLTDSTGSLSNYKDINLNEPNGSIYGIEFSPAGNKLFATVKYSGNSSAIYEYSVDSLLRPKFRQRIPVAADLGAIQIAPTGEIYVATNNGGNNTSLGIIAANEDSLAVSSFNLNGFQLAAGTVSRLGLPNFIQQTNSAIGGPGITVTNTCLRQDSTRFQGASRDQIDNFAWRVTRAGTVVGQSNKASFALWLDQPGDYVVSMTLTNRCDTALTLTKNFTITPPPANPTKGVPLCNTPTATLDANPANAPGLTYEWLTGETTQTIAVDEQGLYNVRITDNNGCVTRGQFVVADSRPIFDLGPDLTICEDNNTPALNVQNPGMTYAWTLGGTPNGNTSNTQAIDTSAPGTFAYGVTVTDPVTSCFKTDNKVYTINVSPKFSLVPHSPTSCGAANGSVDLVLTASTPAGGPLYSYFIQGPSGSQSNIDQTAPNTFTLPNIAAGTYNGVVTDQLSGCTINQVVGVTDVTPLTVTPSVFDNCEATIRINVANGSANMEWTITNSGTGQTLVGNMTTAQQDVTPFPAGDYTVQVKDNISACVNSARLTVTLGPAAPITITPDLCALTLTATAGATSYDWSKSPATSIIGPTNNQIANINPATTGTVTFRLTATQAGFCPAKDSVTLNVRNIPKPVLTQTTSCAETATINVTPTGTFSYRWFTGSPGTLDPTLGGSSAMIDLADNGTIYTVQIYEPQTGCTKDSDPLTAVVSGPVNAGLTSTPPCQDGKPITLTATTSATGPTYSWKLDGAVLTGVTTATTDQTKEGRYEVTVSRGVCNATASLVITRALLPQGNLPNMAIICDDPENPDPQSAVVDLDPGVFASYSWTLDGASLSYTGRVLTANKKGKYAVVITDAALCSNKDETDVLNDCIPIINGPNAFRPGSTEAPDARPDLTNGNFWIFTRFVEDEQFKVFIFNRWGEMVYSSTDRAFKWNGGFNNDLSRPAPPGTYSYVVQYVSAFRPGEGVKEKRGGVALIR